MGKKVLKWTGAILLSFLLLISIGLIILHNKKAGELASGKVSDLLSEILNTEVRISGLDLDRFNKVNVRDIYIEDRKGDTLLFAGDAFFEIDIRELFSRTLSLEEVSLTRTYLNLRREQGETKFNYERVFEELVEEDAAGNPWEIKLDKAKLSDLRMDFVDEPLGMSMFAHSGFLRADIEELVSADGTTLINMIVAEGLSYRIIKKEADLSLPPEQKEAPEPWAVSVKDLRLQNSSFAFDDLQEPVSEKGIDWAHFRFSNIKAAFRDIRVAPDFMGGQIEKLSLREKSGFVLDQVNGAVQADFPALSVRIDNLFTPKSRFTETLQLTLPDIEEFEETLAEISADARFDNSVLSVNDLAYFWPEADTIVFLKNEDLSLSGRISGKVSDFQARDLEIILDQNNMFRGNIHARGLPDIRNVRLDLAVDTAVASEPLVKMIAGEPEQIDAGAFGKIRMEGRIQGTAKKLLVNARVFTDAGMVRPNGQISLSADLEPEYFSGVVASRGLHLGRILKNEQLGKISADIKAHGTPESIPAFSGRVLSFRANGYTYQDLLLEGSYTGKKLDARLKAEDKNFRGDLNVSVDVSADPLSYSVSGYIDTLDLQALNLLAAPYSLQGSLKADLQGLQPDSITGTALLESFTIVRGPDRYYIDSLGFLSRIDDRERLIAARSGNFDLRLEGVFSPQNIPAAARHFISHYHSGIESKASVHPPEMNLAVHVADAEGLIKVFLPDLEELDNFKLDARWDSDEHLLEIESAADIIRYSGTEIEDPDLRISGDSQSLEFSLGGSRLGFPGDLSFGHPVVQGRMKKDTLSFVTAFRDTASRTQIDLEGMLAYSRDTFSLNFPRASLVLQGNEWNLRDEAKVRISGDFFRIDDFVLRSDPDQVIAIASGESRGGDGNLVAEARNVRLEEITELIGLDLDLGGELSGRARITGIPGQPGILADISVTGLRADTVALGNLNMTLEKTGDAEVLNVNAALRGTGPHAGIAGSVGTGEVKSLDLSVDIESLDLSVIQPFMEGVTYSMTGDASSQIAVSGTLENPVVNGVMGFPGPHRVGLLATGTEYYFSDEQITIDDGEIRFGEFNFSDPEGNKASVAGVISHQDLEDFGFDLLLKGEDFLFMNNPYSEELPLYGTIYADLEATVRGHADDLDIDFTVATEEGSEIIMSVIPPAVQYSPPKYITFVTPDSLLEEEKRVSARYPLDYSALNLSGKVVVTEDTEIKIIVDPVNGDRITGTGRGELQVSIDEEAYLSLAGSYEIIEGNYTVTFLNLVKRRFDILEGSTVNWYGDPQEGILDVTASYVTEASRYPLVKDQVEDLPPGELRAARRELPVTVYLFLQGELEQPDLTFDIEVPEGTDPLSSSIVSQRLIEIKSSQSELNKQVMGLVAFNQFFPYQGFELQNGAGAGSVAFESVSQFLNSQLAKLTDQVGGFEVDVSIDPGDELDLEAVNLSASRQFGDRLTVSVGGDIPFAQEQAQSYGFLGDYRIFYRLNESGSVKLKVFSRSERDLYTDYVQQVSGFSLHHHKNSDRVGELISW